MAQKAKTKIIKSVESDASDVLRLQCIAYQSEAELYNDFTIQPLTQTLDDLLAEYRKGIVLKAVCGDEIIGSVRAYIEGDTGYISKLIVHPDHQGMGLGKRLLATIESKLQKKRYELFTGGKSERNLQFYEKAGYKRFKEETDESSESGITYVYLEKKANNSTNLALGMCIGISFGYVIGTLTNNTVLWTSIGLCLGIAVGVSLPAAKDRSEKKDAQ